MRKILSAAACALVLAVATAHAQPPPPRVEPPPPPSEVIPPVPAVHPNWAWRGGHYRWHGAAMSGFPERTCGLSMWHIAGIPATGGRLATGGSGGKVAGGEIPVRVPPPLCIVGHAIIRE